MRSASPIIPAALVLSREELTKHLDFSAETSGSIHIDVIDGKFSSGGALSVDEWPQIEVAYSEAHLMVMEPMSYLGKIKEKGVTRAIVHIESDFNTEKLVEEAKKTDLLLGFAVNPDSDLELLRPYYGVSSYFQVMGVDPGRVGQSMLDTTDLAVSYIRRTSANKRLIITVDGGITKHNIPELKKAGANYFVSSNAIYGGEKSWHDNYRTIVEAAK